MTGKHKTTPLSIRLPDGERRRLYDYAERAGQPVRRVIADAIREKLDREDYPSSGGSHALEMPPSETARTLSLVNAPESHLSLK